MIVSLVVGLTHTLECVGKCADMNKPVSITTLASSPDADRRARMVKYSITMGIRFVCIIAMLFVQGWWLVLCAAGAIVLPYFAMIIANVASKPKTSSVERPSHIARVQDHSA